MSVNKEYYALKGVISEMPQEDQVNINLAASHIEQIVDNAGDNGKIALVLVAAKLAFE
jgi:hypothetical protein